MIFLRFIRSKRNLFSKTKKPPGRFFEGSVSWELLNRGNSLVRDMSPNLSFQCSRSQATTSRTLDTSLAHPVYQWLLPVAISRVLPGWTQDDSYRIRRSGRTERGFVHTVQLGANCLPELSVTAWNEINAAITAE
jgi:hypothetical protein